MKKVYALFRLYHLIQSLEDARLAVYEDEGRDSNSSQYTWFAKAIK